MFGNLVQPCVLRCPQGVLRALCVTQSTGSYERGREERRWGRACDGLWEVFFPPVQEKQFVVPSPSRKHLFPLNQQCKNGVSVWVKAREREKGDGAMAGRHAQLCSPASSASLPWLCTGSIALHLRPNLLCALSPAAQALFPSSAPNHP